MNELQYKMKAKSHYQPSKTVEALFTTAVGKIKASADKAIAKQKAMSETEVVSAKAGVEAKTKEPILEQKVEPKVEAEAAIDANTIGLETDSFEQTGTNETKSEAEAVSQKESEETLESGAEQEVEAEGSEQKTEGEEPKAEEEIEGDTVEDHIQGEEELQEPEAVSQKETEETLESKAEQEVETKGSEQKTEGEEPKAEDKIEGDTVEAHIQGEDELQEAEAVSRKETEEMLESEAEQEAEAAEQKAEDADTAFEDVAEEIKVEIKAESQEPAAGEVSKSIRQIAQSQSNQPREQSLAGFGLCAKDVMLKELVWGSPEDSVQQAIRKMQQSDSGYLMVGIDGVLVGIVSNSNITGALSPYLRPVFAKWRRPLDDATLQIRIKWIMSRPVHIVKPKTPLANIMENMCRYGVLCLPVVDQQGKVQGLVTETDIFKVLLELKSSPSISASGNEHKEQSASDHFSDHMEIESTPTMEPDLVAPV